MGKIIVEYYGENKEYVMVRIKGFFIVFPIVKIMYKVIELEKEGYDLIATIINGAFILRRRNNENI